MVARLHCFGESGNAYKAALALELAGVEWEPVFVDFFRGAVRSDDFLALNPMGEVPVLVVDELILTQSGVIQDWVVETTGRLGGRDAAERREIWRWVLYDNQKISGQAGALRFNRLFLTPTKRDDNVVTFLEMRLNSALKVLERVLKGRRWLVGDGVTCADISCCGYLFYAEPWGFDRIAYPGIDAWLDRIAALPGWRHPYDLMPRALPAQKGAAQ